MPARLRAKRDPVPFRRSSTQAVRRSCGIPLDDLNERLRGGSDCDSGRALLQATPVSLFVVVEPFPCLRISLGDIRLPTFAWAMQFVIPRRFHFVIPGFSLPFGDRIFRSEEHTSELQSRV